MMAARIRYKKNTYSCRSRIIFFKKGIYPAGANKYEKNFHRIIEYATQSYFSTVDVSSSSAMLPSFAPKFIDEHESLCAKLLSSLTAVSIDASDRPMMYIVRNHL